MKVLRWGLCIVLAASLAFAATGTAAAGPKKSHGSQRDCNGRGVPTNKISIQEWTFAEYIGFGTDAATQARLENVLDFLSETGYRNIELFTLSGLTAEQMRDLLDEYGLKAPSRHVDVGRPEAPANFDQILADNRVLGVKYFGSGSTPIFPLAYTTEAQWVAYAEYLNELGARARRAGQTLMVHNHDIEFTEVFGDRTVFDILVEHTDRRNVVFQVDLYWATRGLGVEAGSTSVGAADNLTADLLERLGNRVQLAHVKDMASGPFPGRIEIVGRGGIDFPTLFDATRRPLRYYVVEHDPRFGDPTFNPFVAALVGFKYLSCVRF